MMTNIESGGEALKSRHRDPAFAAADLLANASIEATPRQIAALEEKPDWLPAGMRVYVPFLPTAAFEDAFETCRILTAWGLQPVPHLPARAVPSEPKLREWLEALKALEVTQILLIAGDIDTVQGPFPDTMTLLASGLLQAYGIEGIGVAAHPEGHPHASDDKLMEALVFKRDYAASHGLSMWVVTQFSFDEGVLTRWLDRHQTVLSEVPVFVGLAGPTRLKNLLSYATQCGVATTAKALTRNLNAARLLRPWTPDTLLKALATYQSKQPESVLKGIHLFPFGGLKASSDWLAAAR